MTTHPKRRATDRFNGKLKSWGVGIGWTLTLIGWAYSAGAHIQQDEQQALEITRNAAAITRMEANEREMLQDVATLVESVRAMHETVRDLREELREHDRQTSR